MPVLYTIGHSTRNLKEFITILHSFHITHLVDIRTIPKSRYVPWFNESELELALAKEKIHYIHLPELGGYRRPHKDSLNQGWHNANFRGFADYMQLPDFYRGLKKLNLLIKKKNRVVIMCAEALPWRCHRSLIGDAETARHINVFHIIAERNARLHALTSFAVIDRKKRPIKIYYPERIILNNI